MAHALRESRDRIARARHCAILPWARNCSVGRAGQHGRPRGTSCDLKFGATTRSRPTGGLTWAHAPLRPKASYLCQNAKPPRQGAPAFLSTNRAAPTASRRCAQHRASRLVTGGRARAEPRRPCSRLRILSPPASRAQPMPLVLAAVGSHRNDGPLLGKGAPAPAPPRIRRHVTPPSTLRQFTDGRRPLRRQEMCTCGPRHLLGSCAPRAALTCGRA